MARIIVKFEDHICEAPQGLPGHRKPECTTCSKPMAECSYTYKNGATCRGILSVSRRSRRGIPYILCDLKGNHGMSYPFNPLPPSYWGYRVEDFDGETGL